MTFDDTPATLGGLSFDDEDAAGGKDIDSDTPHWFSSIGEDDAAKKRISLVYGVPDSDAVAVSANCDLGTGTRSADIDLIVDVGAAAPGDIVTAVFVIAGRTYSYPARVFESGSEYAGVRLNVGSRAPLWTALQSAQELRIGVEGTGLMSASGAGAGQAVSAFRSGCFAATAATPGPSIQVDIKPIIAAPILRVEVTPKMPVIAVNPVIAMTPGQAKDPEPGATVLICDDGKRRWFSRSAPGTTPVAKLHLQNGAPVPLPAVASAFGEKYSDGVTTLRIADGTALISSGTSRQFCSIE